MSLLIIHLSDLHVSTGSESIFNRWGTLCKAVVAEITDEICSCVIVFSGDAAWGGMKNEFELAEKLLCSLKDYILKYKNDLRIYTVTVPGNHDCDLVSDDDAARNALRDQLGNERPSKSIEDILLKPQGEYFNFAQAVGEKGSNLTKDNPYYVAFDFECDEKLVRFHLLNSSWTSVLNEGYDLKFPIEEFNPPSGTEPHFSIAVIHHPTHWFQMPGIQREIRDKLESFSDLILTGHEHFNETSRRIPDDIGEIQYQEGGVLYESYDPSQCKFNVIRINFGDDRQYIKRLMLENDVFVIDGLCRESNLSTNKNRIDKIYKLTSDFDTWLDELEDPIVHPRVPDLRLSHIFTYPDLRKITSGADSFKREKKSDVIERIKSEFVEQELISESRILITGGDKSGKTSLLKKIYRKFIATERVPLYIKADQIVRSGNQDRIRGLLEKVVKEQYRDLSFPAYEQLDKAQRVLLVDDFQEIPTNKKAKANFLSFVRQRFSNVVLMASGDYFVELLSGQEEKDAAAILDFSRYEICEFGRQRVEEFSLRWSLLGHTHQDDREVCDNALQVCEKIHSLISLGGLPHTPWLLAIMLEHDESPDMAIAAKNGDYGHLYQAVITVSLSKSNLPSFNLNGKFTYLSELAHYLYVSGRSYLSERDSKDFHKNHCSKYDLDFEFNKVVGDLVKTRILREDGGELAFRHKYVYSFFVAYWLSRNIHKQEAKESIKQLGEKLHHSLSANVMVFLSHLTDDPTVLVEMQNAAKKLYASSPIATMTSDIAGLNKLKSEDSFFKLPTSDPNFNRKFVLDIEDERVAKEKRLSHHDGRNINDNDIDDDSKNTNAEEAINECRAALRTIKILGQVLRNKALSMESSDKKSLMEDLIGIQRRLLGFLYGYSNDAEKLIVYLRKHVMRVMVDEKFNDNNQEDGTVSIKREDLRKMWEESKSISVKLCFDLHWVATFSLVKHVASAIGAKELDKTLEKLRKDDNSIPVHLVDLAVRMQRFTKSIPDKEIVGLHAKLKKTGNRIPRIVLEALSWERLLLYETLPSQKQAICEQMKIQVPKSSMNMDIKLLS